LGLYDAFPDQVSVFILVMMRTGAVIFSAPVFGSPNVPAQIKAATTVLFSLSLFPLIDIPDQPIALDTLEFILYALRESLVGLLFGLIVSLFMNSFFIAGQTIDTQMGIGITNIIDPVLRTNIPTMGQIWFLVATLIFLAIGGPYYMIKSLLWSYEVLPLNSLKLPSTYGAGLLRFSADMWLVGLKVGAPAIGTLLLTMIGVGVIAKSVPQMNVFIVGFPLTLSVGILTVYLSMFWFQPLVEDLFVDLFNRIGLFFSSDGI